MIRKYHNHKLQTTLWHCEDEQHNNQETPGRQIQQNHKLSLPHQDDCKTRMLSLEPTSFKISFSNFKPSYKYILEE